jgi:hypothetical protein
MVSWRVLPSSRNPRRGDAQRHELDEIMMIALVATCDCLVIIIIIHTHQNERSVPCSEWN